MQVKNKQAANVQITAEQLLREAQERRLEEVAPPPKQKITDPEELAEFRMGKRKGFEDAIRKNRGLIGNWIKYAAWEESQGEVERARSVYERALDVDHRVVTLWLKYAEMEMKLKQVQGRSHEFLQNLHSSAPSVVFFLSSVSKATAVVTSICSPWMQPLKRSLSPLSPHTHTNTNKHKNTFLSFF